MLIPPPDTKLLERYSLYTSSLNNVEIRTRKLSNHFEIFYIIV